VEGHVDGLKSGEAGVQILGHFQIGN